MERTEPHQGQKRLIHVQRISGNPTTINKAEKQVNGQVLSKTALQKFLCQLCAFGGAKRDWWMGENRGKGSYCISTQREREREREQLPGVVWLCGAVHCGTC